MMTPGKRFIEMAEQTGLFRHCRIIPKGNAVCLLNIGKPDNNMTFAVTASSRELAREELGSLFMMRLKNALMTALEHKEATGLTKASMKAMLKNAHDAINATQAA